MKRYYSVCVVNPNTATITILCATKHATLPEGIACYEGMPQVTKDMLMKKAQGCDLGVFLIEDMTK